MSTILDTLVYDRTYNDVLIVKELKARIVASGLSSLTQSELTAYMSATMKGVYNYTDMNRVSMALKYIAEKILALPGELDAYREARDVGFNEVFAPYTDEDLAKAQTIDNNVKTDWAMTDIPTYDDGENKYTRLIAYIREIMVQYTTQTFPNPRMSLLKLDYSMANDFEEILYLSQGVMDSIEAQKKRLIDLASFHVYSKEVYSGEI